MTRRIQAWMACLFLLSALPGVIWIEQTGGGGDAFTLNDDFEADVTDWVHTDGGGTSDITHNNGDSLGMLERGVYYYNGTSHGVAPSSNDQWGAIIADVEGDINDEPYNLAIAFRMPEVTDLTDQHYWFWVGTRTSVTGAILWGAVQDDCGSGGCSGGDEKIHKGTATNTLADGDMFSVRMLGTGDSTEIAVWIVAKTNLVSGHGGSGSIDPADPSTWGNATECVGVDTTNTNFGSECDSGRMVACTESGCLTGNSPTGGSNNYPDSNGVYPASFTTLTRSIKEFWAGNESDI